jgi:hypothetical protein
MSGVHGDERDRTDQPAPEADSAWLAAYALGLAYSSRSQEERVELLRDATDGRAELLAIAQQRLDLVEVVEPGLRAQARRLLERARTLSATGAAAPAAHGW